MILHCDDGIRHVEAVLEEPTNLTDSQIQIPLNTLPRPIFVTMFIKIFAQSIQRRKRFLPVLNKEY